MRPAGEGNAAVKHPGRAAWRAVGTAVAVMGLAVAALPAQAEPTTVTVSGVVVGEDGGLDTHAQVSVSSVSEGTGGTATVAADGTFEITGLAPGSYYISAGDQRPNLSAEYRLEWWNGTTSAIGAATPVTFTAGSHQVSFELDLMRGVIVTAVDQQGRPLPGMVLYHESYEAATGGWTGPRSDPPITGADGRAFLMTDVGVPYRVCVRDSNYAAENRPEYRYQQNCWQGSGTPAGATPITLGAADRKIERTFAMAVAGRSIWFETPFVHGAPLVGQPVTVESNAWTPAQVTLSYAWFTDDPAVPGYTPVAIAGATSPTFRPTANLNGQQLYVQITGSAPGHVTTSRLLNAGLIGGLTPQLASFRLTGTTTAGSVVTAQVGATVPATATTEIRWYADGRRLPDVFGRTLTITPALAGAAISAQLRVYDFTYGQTSTYQNERYAFASLPGTLTPATPTISGSATIGGQLTATAGQWRPAHLRLDYQWLRNGSPISGATAATYQVVAADNGASLSVRVTGSAYLYGPVSKTSTAVVAGAAITAGAPTITGPAFPQVKSMLLANAGSWAPANVTLAYQWLCNGSPIAGATHDAYSIRPTDNGCRISVRVTGSATGLPSVTATSPEIRRVGLGGVIGPQPPAV